MTRFICIFTVDFKIRLTLSSIAKYAMRVNKQTLYMNLFPDHFTIMSNEK